MDESLLQFTLKAFVTLFVVVDPLGVAPNFVSLTNELAAVERQKTLRRALIVASGVTLFFLLAGHMLLFYLGVTVHAFAISGGILLFRAALPMLFGQRPGLQSTERDEQGTIGEDIAIFPLAIPLLLGPGAITTVLLLTTQADENTTRLGLLAVVIALVYVIS
jgi:multiple antibiotic resistance protein